LCVEKLQVSPAWKDIQQKFFTTGDAAAVQSELTNLVDEFSLRAFRSSLGVQAEEGVALLAVGGFGRRELFPFSDVDILVLAEKESQTARFKEALSEFIRCMWDAGLRLSHSVRTIAECAEIHEGNVELSISLIDRRWLGGSTDVFEQLEHKLPQFLDRESRSLSQHLCKLSRSRHTKYQDTFYHLEPDVKETPGGLRDLHLVEWLRKLKKTASDQNCKFAGPARFLSTVRCFLHYQDGRDQNLLSFEAQEAITAQMFFPAQEPAAFMREYFRGARVIYNEARRALDAIERSESSLLAHFRDWRSRLSNSDFTVSNERVFLRTPGLLESDPAICFRLFEFVARHGVSLAAETERRLEAHQDAFARFCAASPRPLWPALKSILTLPKAALGLRAMHDTGLMLGLFPELAGINCLVVPDYFHRYTVDEHTMVTIEKIGELVSNQDPEKRRFAEVVSEIGDLALLRFALLFHDAGKGAHSGDHARLSVELARQAMERIQMPQEARAEVEFLIEHHLDLSAVMNSRDLHDPATARLLAEKVGTIERLKMLTVLTYGDIAAVNPGAMTPWRLEQLWQCYRIAHEEFVRELETDRIVEVPSDVASPDFIRGFPTRYLRIHSPAEIEAHIRLSDASRPTGVAVHVERAGGVYKTTVVARDMPALFAALAGAISSFGMDILKAEAFSNDRGQILDTFVFADPKRTLELNPEEIERMEQTLEQVARGKLDVEALLRNRRSPAPAKGKRAITARVNFDSESCATATLVEIVAEDRPRLLYDLASTLSASGCNIDVVLIDTQGRRAIDVFYVTFDGEKLTGEMKEVVEKSLTAIC